MNLLTAGVMNGMIGASSNMKLADVSLGVYREAQNKGDVATMKRSIGYANDSMDSAKEDTKKVGEYLEKAQIEATEQAKAEQQADLNKKAQEAAQVREAQRQAAMGGKTMEVAQKQQQTAGNTAHIDTVEISNEGKAAAQVNAKTATVQVTSPQMDTHIPEQTVTKSLPEAKIYTPKGDAKPANVEVKISVKV